MHFSSSSLALALLSSVVSVNGIKDVTIEAFGDTPSHQWIGLNDPVMGGESTGTATVIDGVGVFDGEVVDVPKLSAPGFISMTTRGNFFPDLSSCTGLRLHVMSQTDYKGFRVSFGTNHPAGSMPYASGYKARFDAPVGFFGDVELPFTDFSDNWDPYTGDQVVTCETDQQYCPDETTLKNLLRFEFMAEGVLGEIHLEVKSIKAYGCDDDVVETAPVNTVDAAAFGGPSGGGQPGGGGGYGGGGGDHTQHNQGGGGGGYGQPGGGEGGEHQHNNYVPPVVLANGDIRIETFSNPQHTWTSLNDPVMGGSSSSTVIVKDDAGVFEGEVVDVSFLNAPGFIKMETKGGRFPDVSKCKALKLNVMSSEPYDGFHATFGTHHPEDAQPFVRGYKAPFSAPVGTTADVIIPFTEFSDSWDPKTGDIIVKCVDDSSHCPDHRTLRDFTILSVMGEGVDGKVHLEVNSIDATDCEGTGGEQQQSVMANTVDTSTVESTETSPLVWAAFAFGGVGIAFGAYFAGKLKGISSANSQQMIQVKSGDVV